MAHSLSSSHFHCNFWALSSCGCTSLPNIYTSETRCPAKTWQFPQQPYMGFSIKSFHDTHHRFEKTVADVRLIEGVTFPSILMSFVHLPFLFSPTPWKKTQDTLKPSTHQVRARISVLLAVSSPFSLPWELKSFETPLAWVPPWYPSSKWPDNRQKERFIDLVHAYQPKSTAIFMNYDVTYYGLVEKSRTSPSKNRYSGIFLTQLFFQFCVLGGLIAESINTVYGQP